MASSSSSRIRNASSHSNLNVDSNDEGIRGATDQMIGVQCTDEDSKVSKSNQYVESDDEDEDESQKRGTPFVVNAHACFPLVIILRSQTFDFVSPFVYMDRATAAAWHGKR